MVASVAVVASTLAALSEVAHAASPPVTFGASESFRISGTNPNPVAVTLSDLNGDSIEDVVTGNANPNSVGQEGGGLSILLGNGDGSFVAHSGFGPSAVYSVATSDLDGDGDQDLVAAKAFGAVSIYLGNGDGTFAAPTDLNVGTEGGYKLALADLNGDTFVDIAVTNFDSCLPCQATVSVLLGNGSGGFGPRTAFVAGSGSATTVAVGDVNGDTYPDLAVTVSNGFPDYVALLLGSGDGTFGASTQLVTLVSPSAVALTDLDGDLALDLAVSSSLGGVSVMLGNGDGTFAPRTDHGVGGYWISGLGVEDLNGDGYPDITASAGDLSVLLGNGDGTFDPFVTFEGGYANVGVAVGDVNGDATPDVVVADQQNNEVAVLLNTTGTATVAEAPTILPNASAASGRATVSWTAPASDGGSQLTGYEVTPYVGATAQTPVVFSSTATTQTLVGLTNLTTYTFTVSAINGIGTGPASAGSNAVTPAVIVRFGSPQPKSVVEGNSGTISIGVNVNLSEPSSVPVTVFWSTANGTAKARDYVGGFGWLTFAPGETRKTVTVTVKGDTTVEADEAFSFNLSSPTNALVGTSAKLINILNDD